MCRQIKINLNANLATTRRAARHPPPPPRTDTGQGAELLHVIEDLDHAASRHAV